MRNKSRIKREDSFGLRKSIRSDKEIGQNDNNEDEIKEEF